MEDEEYGIGGNEYKQKSSEGIANIPKNRALFIEHLTDDDAIGPELVYKLGTTEQVFEHYKPTKEISFENEEGQAIRETFRFANVSDFSLKNLTRQSEFLNGIHTEVKFYQSAIKELSTNKVLNRALGTPDDKQNIINVLIQCKEELELNINEED